jgi:N-acetylmuramoyl-L-alanine amidase
MRLRRPPGPFLLVLLLLLILGPAGIPRLSAQERELLALVTELGGSLEWDPLRGLGVIAAGDDRIALQVGVPFVVVDYAVKVDIDPPVMRDGAIFLSAAAVQAVSDAVGRQRLARALERLRVGSVLIDPGHGGKDPGAVGKYPQGKTSVEVREKDVVLAVSKALGRRLAEEYPDKQVLYTRGDDTYISLEDRAAMANALLARTSDTVLYISVHANSTMNRASKPTGFEVWYLPPEYKRNLLEGGNGGVDEEMIPILNSMLEEEITVESIVLARDILAGLQVSVGGLSPSRGLKEESWYVVRNTKMPAVLIEVGFISTPEEAARLAQPAYLNDVAEGIYSGVRAFISRFERGGSPRAQ